MGLVNQGQPSWGNLFVILIILVYFPVYHRAIDQNQTEFIWLEVWGLGVMAGLSLVRLINRLYPIPDLINLILVGAGLVIANILFSASLKGLSTNHCK